MKFSSLAVVIFGLLLISLTMSKLSFALDHDLTSNKYHLISTSNRDNNDNDKIEHVDGLQICCSWSTKLSDGILEFSIEAEEGGRMDRQAVLNAIEEWDSKIEELQLIENEPHTSTSDIKIVFGDIDNDVTGNRYYDFKNKVDEDLTLIPSAGWTQFAFDKQGFIHGTKITISKDVFEQGFDDNLIEQIVKHELGHSLGLGHANYDGSLMANLVIEDKTATISDCEINGIFAANSWKFKDSKQDPEYPDAMFVPC